MLEGMRIASSSDCTCAIRMHVPPCPTNFYRGALVGARHPPNHLPHAASEQVECLQLQVVAAKPLAGALAQSSLQYCCPGSTGQLQAGCAH